MSLSPSNLPAQKKTIKHTILLFLGFVTVAVIMAVWLQVIWDQNRTLVEAKQRASAQARALAKQSTNLMEMADLALLGLYDQVEAKGADVSQLPNISILMNQLKSVDNSIYSISWYDEHGKQVASSHHSTNAIINISDREFFKQLSLEDNTPDTLISNAVRSRDPEHVMILPISRRLNHADGSFAGVLNFYIRLSELQAQYDAIPIGKYGSIELSSPLGEVLVRSPYDHLLIGRALKPTEALQPDSDEREVTTIDGISPYDGRHRIGTRVQTARYGLLVQVAYSQNEVLKDWMLRSSIKFGLLLVLVAVMAIFSVLMIRYTDRQAKSEALFRLLAEHSTDIIVCLDGTGNMVYISPSFWGLTGWTPGVLEGQLAFDFVVTEDLPLLWAGLQEVKDGKADQPIRFRYRLPNGDVMWVEMLARLAPPMLGAPIMFVCNVREITTQKRSEDELLEANESLLLLMLTDPLTNLPNRRAFDRRLINEWMRGSRNAEPLALLLIDIDRFKLYNDINGHLGGDACLRDVADIMASVLQRTGDFIARYGGEEFVVLLPNTEPEEAMRVAEHLRLKIFQTSIAHVGSDAGVVTVSIGVAGVIPCPHLATDHLVQLADAALYQAKEAGRNRVALSSIIASLSPLRDETA